MGLDKIASSSFVMRSQLRPLSFPLLRFCYHCLLDSVQGVGEQLIDFSSILSNIQEYSNDTYSVGESILHFISEHQRINSLFLPRNLQSKGNQWLINPSHRTIYVWVCVHACVCVLCMCVSTCECAVCCLSVCMWIGVCMPVCASTSVWVSMCMCVCVFLPRTLNL